MFLEVGLGTKHFLCAMYMLNGICCYYYIDSLLLRFLRARKWNVTNGMNMILKAFKWRLEDDIEEVKSKSEDELDAKYKGFRLQMEMGKSFVHGTDKMGRPVV